MQVAVGGVELNVVEPCLPRAYRRLSELLTDLRDPTHAQLDRGLTEQRLGDRRGGFSLELVESDMLSHIDDMTSRLRVVIPLTFPSVNTCG